MTALHLGCQMCCALHGWTSRHALDHRLASTDAQSGSVYLRSGYLGVVNVGCKSGREEIRFRRVWKGEMRGLLDGLVNEPVFYGVIMRGFGKIKRPFTCFLAVGWRRSFANHLRLDELAYLKAVSRGGFPQRWISPSVQIRRGVAGAKLDTIGDGIADDYYSLLGLLPDATSEDIKRAYYSCMKACHPDLSGDDPETTSFCMLVNEVYEVLSDPVQRMVYDEIHGYSLKSTNPFLDSSRPRDHSFVDEFSCIGCKNCANTAPLTFDIEGDFGRARVVSQSGDPSLVQQAIETCPVDCIHWVSSAEVSLLEAEMRKVERVNVGMMLSGMGYQAPDVFALARSRWEKQQARVREKARIRIRNRNTSANQQWWQGFWNKSPEQEAKERSEKVAAAARRWREYSRKEVEHFPIYNLPEKGESQIGEHGYSQ
eukprot:c21806_g1_i1 orf=196-1476(+)